MIGAQFGAGFEPRVGVVAADGEVAESVIRSLGSSDEIIVVNYRTEDDLLLAVERGTVSAGVVIPPEIEGAGVDGAPVEVGFVARSDGLGPQLRAVVAEAVAVASEPLDATGFVRRAGRHRETRLGPRSPQQRARSPEINVEVRTAGESLFPTEPRPVRHRRLVAAGAVHVPDRPGRVGRGDPDPEPRRGQSNGGNPDVGRIDRGRGGTGPVRHRSGPGALHHGRHDACLSGRLGRPAGRGCGRGGVRHGRGRVRRCLFGSLFSNDQQAGSVGVVAGIGLAAVGGSMLPLEFYGDGLRMVSRLTPHAWANDAFAELVRRDGTIADVLPQLGALACFAAVFLVLASWRMRQVLTD